MGVRWAAGAQGTRRRRSRKTSWRAIKSCGNTPKRWTDEMDTSRAHRGKEHVPYLRWH